MYNPEKTKTWADNWNDIIRTVLFPDEKLKTLLMIPEKDRENIMAFITEYFVKFPMTDEVVTGHKVRVIYDEEQSTPMNIPQAVKRKLVFDIFVKSDEVHTADDDRLKDRAVLIYERIKYLLTRTQYVCNMRFQAEDDYGVGAKTIGYRRYRGVFSYKKTY